MGASSAYVRLQVLLGPSRRNDKDIAEVQDALRKLGFEVTGVGKASISARATPEVLAKVFQTRATSFSDGTADAASELPVPPQLSGYVDSITVAPQHIAMSERSRAGKRRDKS